MSDNFYCVNCPHCNGSIIILHNEINCRIFRHGAYRENMQPIPPHASKVECDSLVAENRIVGCGKPFRVEDGIDASRNRILNAIICDYI